MLMTCQSYTKNHSIFLPPFSKTIFSTPSHTATTCQTSSQGYVLPQMSSSSVFSCVRSIDLIPLTQIMRTRILLRQSTAIDVTVQAQQRFKYLHCVMLRQSYYTIQVYCDLVVTNLTVVLSFKIKSPQYLLAYPKLTFSNPYTLYVSSMPCEAFTGRSICSFLAS